MHDHYRKLERMYLSAPSQQRFKDLAIAISESTAEVSFDLTPDLHHAADSLHGCYYFKALDDAAFFAANSLVDDVFVLTADFVVQFFRPVASGRVTSVGTVVKPGRSLLFVDAVMKGEDGQELARGRGTFTRSKMLLDAIARYR